MPSLEDVEMSNSSSSEIREVEMEDINSGPGSSPEAPADQPEENHVTSQNHMTSEEQSLNSDDHGEVVSDAMDTGNQQSETLPSDVAPSSEPLPSVEKDGTESTTTAEVEPNSPVAAVERMKSVSILPPTKPQREDTVPSQPALAASESIKLEKEMARLREVLSDVSPEAAQKVLKEKWRVFLFDNYNEDHIAFILRAGLKNSNPAVLERVLRDEGVFKESMMRAAARRPGFVEKVLRASSASTIEANVPEKVIDQIIAERFKTVPGKTLIKWLAEAERLGYKADDILDDEDESVAPNVQSRDQSPERFEVEAPPTLGTRPLAAPQISGQSQVAEPNKDSLLVEQERQAVLDRVQASSVLAAIARNAANNTGHNPVSNVPGVITTQPQQAQMQTKPTGPLKCPHCSRSFGSFSGYNYHVTKKVCAKQPPYGGYKWSCANCLSGFTTKQGMDYHNMRRVCYQEDDIAPATAPLSASKMSWATAPTYSTPPSQPTRTTSGPILPPIRPPMYIPQLPPRQAPYSHQEPRSTIPTQTSIPTPQAPSTQVSVSRPAPITTPISKVRNNENVRHSPNELSPEKRAALEKALREVQDRAEENIAAIPKDWTEEERRKRITSIKNGLATRSSQIRKAHGVSLRMRENEKQARVAAGLPAAAKMNESLAPSISTSSPNGTPAGSPPASSFSPINPPRNNSTPPSNYNNGHPQSQYKPPPPEAVQITYSPFPNHPNTLAHAHPAQGPLTQAHENSAGASSFGVLRGSKPMHVTQNNYPAPANYIPSSLGTKRKRESRGTTPAGNGSSTSALSMMEISSEDAAARFAKPKKVAGDAQDTPMEDTPNGTTGFKNAIIEILSSSSESEDVDLPAKSIEEGDRAGSVGTPSASRGSSTAPRAGFMARRGGKH